MRKTVMAALPIVAVLIGALGSIAPQAALAAAAPSQAKVVIIVGPVEGTTSSYRSDADAAAATARKYTSNVTQIYSPNATWNAVLGAIQGANIVVYLGHGNGWPSPYAPFQENTKDGMGLNATAGAGDSNNTYYGASYIKANIRLASNAIVLLNHLCYSAGNGEPGMAEPDLLTAQQRADNMSNGWLAAGAGAVVAEMHGSISPLIDSLFTTSQSVEAAWKAMPDHNGNYITSASARTAGATVQLDPDTGTTGYYRSIVGSMALTTNQVVTMTPQPAGTPSTYVALPTPVRVLDTRSGLGLSGKFDANTGRDFQVTGVAGIPATAIAVTGNVTVMDQTYKGWVGITPVAPLPGSSPATSNLNFPVGDVRSNAVTVSLDTTDGSLGATYVAPGGNTANLAFDVTGYFVGDMSGSTYKAIDTPARVLDTRYGTGLSGAFTSGVPRTFQITGVGGVPAGATAVTGNLTVTNQTSGGNIALVPAGAATPGLATLNFPVGDVRADAVTMGLSTGGALTATFTGASGATAQVVFDVTGYFVADATGYVYVALPTPARLLDSRYGNGVVGAFQNIYGRNFVVAGRGGVPAEAKAVTANFTVTNQTYKGWAALTPSAPPVNVRPATSTLNFPVGDVRANSITLSLSAGSLGATYVAVSGATAHLVCDITGYFLVPAA